MKRQSSPEVGSREAVRPAVRAAAGPKVLMLLTNAYDPDPRVQREALALIGMGCQVRILAWDRDLKSAAHERMEGVEVERVFLASTHGRGSLQILFYVWLYVKMLWRAFRTSFDVIHCHDLDTLPMGFLLGKLKRKPIVYDSHESFADMLEGNVHPAICRAIVRLENFLIRRVDLLITVGEKLRGHFVERGSPHSVVVGNWKRLEDYSRSGAENRNVREQLSIPQSALVITCITNLFNDRKIEELLDAIDHAASWSLIIGGKGALEEKVKQRAAKNPRIHFIGFVANKDIPTYTCVADAIYYGFDPANPNARFSAPNKLFEALAAGRALVTGDFGEIADVVRSGQCGVVLPEYSAAAIVEALNILEDAEQRSGFAANAKLLGESGMNWSNGEETLFREYSRLMPDTLQAKTPRSNGKIDEGTPRESAAPAKAGARA